MEIKVGDRITLVKSSSGEEVHQGRIVDITQRDEGPTVIVDWDEEMDPYTPTVLESGPLPMSGTHDEALQDDSTQTFHEEVLYRSELD